MGTPLDKPLTPARVDSAAFLDCFWHRCISKA